MDSAAVTITGTVMSPNINPAKAVNEFFMGYNLFTHQWRGPVGHASPPRFRCTSESSPLATSVRKVERFDLKALQGVRLESAVWGKPIPLPTARLADVWRDREMFFRIVIVVAE